jgi:ribosomal-protein-alanine N-acetyltransferase
VPVELEAKTTIEPLSIGVLPELLRFERVNREYFAEWVPDRGDDYFSEFRTRNQALLDEQSAGGSFFFVARNEANRLVGRVNLVDVASGSASLGYRIAQDATGVGHAGRAVQLAILFAHGRGLQTITAMTTLVNRGSQKVLERAGFIQVAGGPASVVQNGVQHELVHYALSRAKRVGLPHASSPGLTTPDS